MAELFDILTYDFQKAPANLDVPDTFVDIANLVAPTRPAGVYEMGMSITWTFDRTNRSAYMRFSGNGGTTWNDFTAEPKDSTDANVIYYAYPKIYDGVAPLQIQVQARKETAAGTLAVNFVDVWIKRIQ